MEMVDVLEPMMASGRAAALIRARVWCLIAMTSGTASSMKSASATASSMSLAAQRFSLSISVEPCREQPGGNEFVRFRQQPLVVLLRHFGGHIRQRDACAAEGQDLRDPAAHVAGADDGDLAGGVDGGFGVLLIRS